MKELEEVHLWRFRQYREAVAERIVVRSEAIIGRHVSLHFYVHIFWFRSCQRCEIIHAIFRSEN